VFRSARPTTCYAKAFRAITDLITILGPINLDFADVRTIMHDAGSALIGIGTAIGLQTKASTGGATPRNALPALGSSSRHRAGPHAKPVLMENQPLSALIDRLKAERRVWVRLAARRTYTESMRAR